MPGLSFDVTLPEPADLVVSEVLGNLVDNEGSTAILADAARRFLRPGGAMLPRRAERYLVPVEAPNAHTAVAGGGSAGPDGGGSPFDAYYDVILPRAGYLASPRLDRAFEPDDATDAYARELVFPVDRAGRLHGFKGWFVADLSPTVALDIGGDRIEPAAARTTSDSWRHAYLPIAEPVDVEPFDRLALRFERRAGGPGDPFGQSYRWSGALWRSDAVVASFDQHT